MTPGHVKLLADKMARASYRYNEALNEYARYGTSYTEAMQEYTKVRLELFEAIDELYERTTTIPSHSNP